ncbi:MAG: hypothetical protein CVV22_00390 [Ignavibacteriae bacterium HGW-Ignavibacteriae-1]|nr:MAG: hypothetical protein CVV22_00390 [Ignavibacteriae bacterium HGW-Ignavibacteriae-1]
MNENIKYNDLIYLVIDGEANEIESSTLFAALNDNIELQNEFQAALKLNRASEAYVTDSAVPIGLTSKLFTQAGLTYVPMATTTAAKVATGAVLSKFMKSTLSSIGFTVLGLVLGAAIMYLLSDSKRTDEHNKNQYTINNRQIQFTKSDKTYPEMSSFSEVSEVPKVKKIIPKSIINPEDSQNDMTFIENDAPVATLKIVPEINKSQYVQNQDNLELKKLIEFEYINENNSEIIPISMFDFSDLGLSVEVKNASYWNLPKESIYPSEISKFHNMSVSLLYDLSENWKIGGEVRHETFYVKYLSTDALRQDFIFEQQPNLTSYGALIRYSFYNTESLKMFAQNNFSANYYGLVFRGSLGVEYYIIPELSILCAVDFAGLYYKHQTRTNTSEKVGISYGINFKL